MTSPDPREARLDAVRALAARGKLSAEVPAGYHGQPALKPPVWTWEVPLYFFIGGIGGMAGVLALASLAGDAELGVTRAALWLALLAALASPALLILDLGRPARFLNMLRVFKWRSPMSVGVWTLVAFSTFAAGSVFLYEAFALLADIGLPKELLAALLSVLIFATGLTGGILATYAGVLLGATAIPAWHSHRLLLPVHFGFASLGSAAALLELLELAPDPLALIFVAAAIVETVIFALTELAPKSHLDRPLRHGSTGTLMRCAGALAGPIALGFRFVSLPTVSALAFLAGALLGRYAWVAVGRASSRDVSAALTPGA
jgi:formate-dependent nitrite reductase membrane component NrfD